MSAGPATAVVTGGARGIGRAIAADLRAAGARVLVVDLTEPDPADGVEHVVADVTDPAAVAAVAGWTDRLDVLVNNAGIYRPVPFRDMDVATWRTTLDVNLTSAFVVTQALLGPLAAAGGSVVNLSSGLVAKGAAGLSHYIAAKAGIVGLTRALARELGPDGIRVNAVAPGLIDTPTARTELGDAAFDANRASRSLARDGTPDDVIGTVRYLASPAAAFVTGQVIVVDGGSVFW